jgi:aminoglycoside phosphotransferase (APT) family kinase protein
MPALLDELPARFAELATCGLDDGLVHGDFFPGNVRWTDDGPVLLDWGDCGVGHPLLDMTAFLDRAADDPRRLADHWIDRWTEHVPDSDPRRASALIAPIGALRNAIVYQNFLDGIEETERVYHRDDVPIALTRAMQRRVPSLG